MANQNVPDYKKIKIESLIPYINNSRTHSDEQVAQIAASIKEFGFTNPVLIDGDGGIIAGHGRVMAARKLNLNEVPCIVLSHLSEAQKKAYIIADNQLPLNAGWDLDMLRVEIENLQEMDFDLDLLGFDDDMMDSLLDVQMEEGLTDEDEVPEPPEKPVSVLGDIWQLGDHRLMCGDSTSIDAVEKLMDGKKADMVFTDPPYGVSYQNNQTKKHDVIKNDDVFLDEWIPLVEMFSTGFIFMWTSYQVVGKWISITEPFGSMTNMVIWNKGGGGLGDLKGAFSTDFEIALVWNRGAKLQDKRIGSVWSVSKDNGASYVHPTQKPVELMEKGVYNCTKYHDIVMDLFLGSGSTLIACEKINRKCYGMELDEKYVDVIIKRWQDFTGKKAVHIESGKTYEELLEERLEV